MKIRKLMLSALLGGSVLASGGFGNEAEARSGAIRLTPLTNWTMSKVSGNSSSGDYCTMARQFSNNLVLTIARNISGETSLALDFQRETLNPGKIYTVILVSGDVSRAFDVEPVSRKAFVVRTGKEDSLYTNIEKFRHLDINFAGKVYRFVIEDLSEGQNHLGACVSSLVEPAAGSRSSFAETKRVPAAVYADGSGEFNAAVTREQDELMALREKLSRMRDENSALSSQLEQTRTVSGSGGMRVAADSNLVGELNEKLKLLESENLALRKSVGEYQIMQATSSSKDGRIQVLEQEISALEDANERLRKRLESASANDGIMQEVIELQNDKAKLERQNRELQARLEQQSIGGGGDWKAAKAELDKEIASLEAKNSRLEKSLDETQKALREAHTNLVNENSNDVLVNELENKLSTIRSEKRQLEIELDDLRRGSANSAALKTEMETLITDLAAERKTNVELRGKIDEMQQAQSSSANASQTREHEIARLNSRISELEAVNKGLYSSLENTKLQLSKAGKADEESLRLAEGRASALESRLEQARQQNLDLEGQLKLALAAANSRKENEESQKKLISQLQSEVEELIKENTGLRKNLSGLKDAGVTSSAAVETRHQNVAVAQLKERIDSLLQENNGLRDSVNDLQKRLEEKSYASGDRSYLKYDFDTIKLQLAAAEDANKQLAEELEIYKKASELAPGKANVSGGEAEIRLGEAQKEILRLGALLKKDREQCSAEINILESKLFDPAVTEMEQIQRLKDMQARLGDAETARKSCEQHVADLSGRIDGEKQKIIALYNEISEKNGKIAELEVKLTEKVIENNKTDYRDEIISELESRLNQSQERIAVLARQAEARQQDENTEIVSLAHQYNKIETGSGAAMNASQIEQAALDAMFSAPEQVESEESFDAVAKPQVMVPGKVSVSEVSASGTESIARAVNLRSYQFISVSELGRILRDAGIRPVEGSVQMIDAVSNANMVAFRWDTGEVYGTAEQKGMDHPAQFNDFVAAYLEQAKSRCAGDFAAIPAKKKSVHSDLTSLYEIACVSSNMDSSASLLFYGANNTFTIIAHETSTDNMDVAMDYRDNLIEVLDPATETAAVTGGGKDL